MNYFKGTSGKWFQSGKRGTLITSNNGEANQWEMANVCWIYGGDDEERQANAKLISAARDMMEALQAIIEHSEKEDICDGVEAFVYTPTRSPELSKLLKDAKEALSKALD